MSKSISVKNLAKMYSISHENVRYRSFRDDIMRFIKDPLSSSFGKKEKFYALKDVSFSLEEGETLGIIGSNGAGKSTLLKLISRITPPTRGEIHLSGRVASLLEVGTGFHLELTGRENIFLSGAILGMKQVEVRKKFEEIVDFAGVEKFLDTPVKHYSSGMFTRLAFSVAAHLDSEILIVDEVLAVGDAAFQKKCLGKMNDIGKSGRTIMFVSHNMTTVNALCKKTILLENGKIVDFGRTSSVINRYLTNPTNNTGIVHLTDKKIKKYVIEESRFAFSTIEVINSKGNRTKEINLFESFSILITGNATQQLQDFSIGFSITSTLGVTLFNSYSSDVNMPNKYKKGRVQFLIEFNKNYIAPGMYIIDLVANGSGVNTWIPEAISLHIVDRGVDSIITQRPSFGGLMIHPQKWNYITNK